MKPLFRFSVRYFLRTSSSSLLMLYRGPEGAWVPGSILILWSTPGCRGGSLSASSLLKMFRNSWEWGGRTVAGSTHFLGFNAYSMSLRETLNTW